MELNPALKEKISLDKNSLDYECMRQSMLYAEASERLATTTFKKDTCKEELETLKCEIDMEVRADPESFGLMAKPTESAIRAASLIEKRIVEKTEEFLSLTYLANEAMGIKNAFEHKKTMLELLVKLYISGYYADPVVNERAMVKNAGEVVEKEIMDTLQENPRMKRRMKNVEEVKVP